MKRILAISIWPVLSCWGLLAYFAAGAAAQVVPCGHAHNDYAHDRPLLDALSQGFGSVEADIFLRGDELMVGHEVSELREGRTLQSLYLDPLRKRAAQYDGAIYSGGPEFILLIDIKTEGTSTYKKLAEVLIEYRDILTEYDSGTEKIRGVRVIISGNRDQAAIATSSPRLAGIDGRLTDLGSSKSVNLMPLISDRWSAHFEWQGKGEFPDAERQKLTEIVRKVHKAGRKLRFWATPDTEAMWSELSKANVDLINADDLAGLSQFLAAHDAAAGDNTSK